ncbi:MAG: hypothetical protein EBS01_11090, partial [Verrucomicrobia bacterium]|nr:hypothetical protein [Verrucomicrobiota bacterium]
MFPDIERLLLLQDRDKKARQFRTELKNIPLERKALEEKLNSARNQASETKAKLRAAEVEQARLENDIRSRREQIAKYETQKMQTRKNEEFTALNHSIEHVKKEIAGIEDRQLELMEALEGLKPETEAAEKAAVAAAALVQRQLTDLEAKEGNLKVQLAELEASRPQYTSGIDEDLLDDYNRLFASKTVAVVELHNEVCAGC